MTAVPLASDGPAVPRLRRRSSMRFRITAVATLIVGATLALGSWALVASVERRLADEVEDQQQDQLQRVQALLSAGLPVSPSLLTDVAGPTTVLAVIGSDGRALAATSPDLRTSFSDAIPARAQGGGSFEQPITGVAGGAGTAGDILYVTGLPPDYSIRTTEVDTPNGTVTLLTANSLEDIQRSVTALRQYLMVGIPFLAVAAGLATWWLVGRALRPVDAMCAEVDEITAHTITRRVPEPTTGDEIQHLARTMNAMLGRLDEAQARQRRFVSDASHELRSPVTVTRTNLEVALAHPAVTDWPAVATTVLQETGRLDRLVADLLDLARLDESGRPWDEVDLDEVVLDEAGRFPIIGAQGVSAGRVVGDRRLLARLVRNLCDNAVRHARTGVTVSLARADETVTLLVEDDGAGIPAADRERVFERFTRLEEGRTRDDGGAGLGLALVRRIAEQHGGRVRAEAGRTGGARFVVELPAAR
jgi:signal transduction histidine kinase